MPGQVITTVAGTDFVFPSTPLPALNAPVGNVESVAVDAQGNVYAVDWGNNIVVRISPNGALTVVAGNGIGGFSGDGGPATSASVDFYPASDRVTAGGVAVDSAGNLYIAENLNRRIRKVSGGTITTVAGNGLVGFSGDGGPATSASLNGPLGVAVDSAGNLYIADEYNNRIRKVSGGTITTVAGNGTSGYSGDGGPATSASLNLPTGVAVDSAGNLYVADFGNARIRKVSGGTITTVAGNGFYSPLGDGGPATSASLVPMAVAVDSAGSLYIADTDNDRIRKVSAGTITTVAGNGLVGFSGDGGPPTSASLYYPMGVAVDSAGSLYIADERSCRIRKVSGGTIATVAGNGDYRFSGDGGPATNASLNLPYGVAVSSAGNLYVADSQSNRIRKVSGGTITTVAGNGLAGFSGDGGPATSAQLYLSEAGGVAVDPAGNLYIADTGNDRIRKVSGGTITTVAGNGLVGFSGDGGIATSASLFSPQAVAVDAAGNLYIADTGNYRIRKVSGGTISSVAGNGTAGFSGDGGPATSASLYAPFGVAVDSAGNLYIADEYNRIRKVSGGTITTAAGNGTYGFLGDGGPATSASLNDPFGVAVDSTGNLYIADYWNHRIREVLAASPQVLVSPNQLQFSGASAGRISLPQTASLTSAVSGLAFSVQVEANAAWLNVTPSSGAFPRLIEVTADPTNLQPGTYSGTITITAPYAVPANTNVQVTFAVGPGQPPQLAIDKSSLSFPFPESGSSRSQTTTVSNAGGGVLPFSASTQTATGGDWLSVSPGSGQASPSTPVSLSVTASPAGLQPGTYSGALTIIAGTSTQIVSVTMTVSQLNQAILLSQTGLSFLGVANGGVILPQSFGVVNIGSGVVNWTVTTSTLSGGNWLQVDTSAGSTDAAANTVPTVGVSASVAGLAAGKYYGLVRVDAPGAANTPQVLTAFLQVLPSGSATSAAVQPGELLFAATTGAESPGSQEILVSDISGLPTSFRAASPDLTVLPVDNTLDPKNPTHVVVQPFTASLAPGVYDDFITFQFSDGNVSAVNVKIIVANSSQSSGSTAASSASSNRPSDAGPCQPTQLLTALTTLGQSFAVSAGFPVALGVQVQDDCGNPLDMPGSVVVSFSNGDPPLPLQSLKGGRWEGTWSTSGKSLSQVNLTIQANDPQRQLQGKSQISGALQSPTDPPIFTLQGVVSAAEPQSFVAPAPGAIISVFGDLLAEENTSAAALPLPTALADTHVIMAGELLPLFYASQGQVNALVPYDININTPQQVYVQRGLTYSQPVSVNVAPAQPAVFEDTSVSPNQGIVIVVRGQGASQSVFEAKPGTPATTGDVIVLFCAGLGAVTPAIPSGSAAGSPVPTTTNNVQLTIGGHSAVVVFAGLAPGFAGLYQVNASVPSGVSSGNAVPVTLSVAGQTGPPVTMAVQ